jgi:hypothetical protein
LSAGLIREEFRQNYYYSEETVPEIKSEKRKYEG